MDLTERAVWLPPLLRLAAVPAVYGAIAAMAAPAPGRSGVGHRPGCCMGSSGAVGAPAAADPAAARLREPADEEGRRVRGGFDLLMQRGTERYLVQCKHGGSYTIGAAAVRKLLGLLEDQGLAAPSGHHRPLRCRGARRRRWLDRSSCSRA